MVREPSHARREVPEGGAARVGNPFRVGMSH
jgi:hypothetical protein